MLKRSGLLFTLVFLIFFILCCIPAETTMAAGENQLNAWNPPAGTTQNNTFTVQVRKSGDLIWTDLFEYNVKVGHQDGSSTDSSMVNFDFSGTVDVKVTYNSGIIGSYDIRPASYGINAAQNGNTLDFSITQDDNSPRKIVIRINNDWEGQCLHIVTNPTEVDAPSEAAPNVYVINPGDQIPLQLPVGKDTYYFKPGLHTLPEGLWVEIDLGAAYSIDRIDLDQGVFSPIELNLSYPQRFLVETRVNYNDNYTTAYDGTNNTELGYLTKTFTARNARYVRLKLLGSNVSSGWIFTNVIKEFKVYETNGSTNLALNHAIAGAMPCYPKAVDGDSNTQYSSVKEYGNWHSGESFFLSKDNYTVYIAGGAVVQGSISADEVSNVTVRGRGILDCSQLQHVNPNPGEARTGAVWLTSGSDNKVEGITILDPAMWTVVMNFSTRPVVKNINIFGRQMNCDGIHMSGSNNGTIDGVFIRTCDDNIVMYHYAPTYFNTVKNSVFWGDDARIFLLGMGHKVNSDISDITIQNSDVLNQQGVVDINKYTGVLQIWPNGGNEIRNIVFKDIRIDSFRDPYKSAVFKFRTDEWLPGEGTGKIKNVTLQNITYNGSGEQQALLMGVDGNYDIKDIYIGNYKRLGYVVNDIGSGNMDIQGYVSNVNVSQSNVSGIVCGAACIIASRNSCKLMSVDASIPTADGSNIYQWGNVNNVMQEWVIADAGGGYYKIINKYSGKLMSIDGTYPASDGDNIHQWEDVGSDMQLWQIIDAGEGYYKIVNKQSGKLVSLDGNNPGMDGDNICQWADTGSACQQWSFSQPISLLDNNFNNGITGSAPGGWICDPGITVQEVPSASDKSVRMSKAADTSIVASKSITASSGIITVECKMNIIDKTNWKSLLIYNSTGNELMQVGFDSGGNIYSCDGSSWTSFMPYNANQWYSVKAVINTDTDKYDLYIDGALKRHDYSLEVPTGDVGAVKFGSSEAAAGTFYFNDVKVTLIQPISLLDNNFNNGITGSAPGGWICDPGITVQEVPSASDKSVRMSKAADTSIVASKSITASSGIITVECKMNITDKTNWKSLLIYNSTGNELMQVGFDSGGNIYSCDGSSWTSFMPYNANQWYSVKAVINTDTDKYDLYIDGTLIRHDYSLEVPTGDVGAVKFGSSEAAAGTFYFNDVKVILADI